LGREKSGGVALDAARARPGFMWYDSEITGHLFWSLKPRLWQKWHVFVRVFDEDLLE